MKSHPVAHTIALAVIEGLSKQVRQPSDRHVRKRTHFLPLRSHSKKVIRQRSTCEALVCPHQTIELIRFRDELICMNSDPVQLDGEMNLNAFVVMDVEFKGSV